MALKQVRKFLRLTSEGEERSETRQHERYKRDRDFLQYLNRMAEESGMTEEAFFTKEYKERNFADLWYKKNGEENVDV